MSSALLKEEPISGLSCLTVMRPNILIVDDRKEHLLLTEKSLKSLGAMIFKATSGREALFLMMRHSFAVVLLDVRMPEMDGFETARLIHEQEDKQATPIIFFSALSQEEKYAAKAAHMGAVDYIFKPINPEILKSKIRVYLDLYVQREQIVQLNNHLRQSNEELERFAYICSHDMQEPVRMMNSYAQLLVRKYNDLLDEKGRKYLEFISRNASHMQKMIHDILAFSRAGREELECAELDSSIVLGDVLRELGEAIEASGARITVGMLPTVFTSPTLLRILFQNLIGNAIKFQPKGAVPEITVEAENRNNEWRFCVTDNGIGIAENAKEKVFTIFQRLNRREEYPGTGIGLSTCKKFIEMYGGAIWFESRVNVGSRFYFTLPMSIREA